MQPGFGIMVNRHQVGWALGLALCLFGMSDLVFAGAEKIDTPASEKTVPKIANPFPDPYGKTHPDFLDPISPRGNLRGWVRSSKEMKLSQEKSFFTFTTIKEDSRAYALVEAAMKKEADGRYREALKIYKELFDKILNAHPDLLYRVSKHGIFVPVAEFVQRRILGYPKEELDYYRTLHDARAKEAFEQARRRYSLIGFSEITGTMLATSYGDNALLELGNAALDTGHLLSALERFTTIRDFFPHSECQAPELDLKIEYCKKLLGEKKDPARAHKSKGTSDPKRLAKFQQVVNTAKYEKPPFHVQRSNAPHVAGNDYTMWPPTEDPLALKTPVWKKALPGTRRDYFVYTQPVVTDSSVIYRHKNILYCRSVLNGELRWQNTLGGRAVWQNWDQRQYPQDDVLVQDGLVITPMYKVGPSLVALDEVTGQLKWAYGPMVASTIEESHMRFEAAPAGGPRTVFAPYILDNIEGETHTDSEYGVMAFESATGRVRWRTQICRLLPGKFSGGFAKSVRNRIRSFTSPPMYHEGTLYCTTNAGAITALDAQSGRIKWLMRYPYHPGVHDATRQFGRLGAIHGGTLRVRPHSPMFWLNQRPLLIGERLYVLPVDTPFMLCLDRRTGRVLWSRQKMGAGFTHLLGAIRSGELVMVTNGRAGSFGPVFGSSGKSGPPVFLLDPKTGKTTWTSPDVIMPDDQPVMKNYIYSSPAWFCINRRWFENAARPFLTTDGKVFITNWTDCSIYWRPGMHVYHLAGVDLIKKKVIHQRRFYSNAILTHADGMIRDSCKKDLDSLVALPHKDAKAKTRIKCMQEIVKDTVPENEYGPFMPFSRMTFERYGENFELHLGPRSISMTFNPNAVREVLTKRTGPDADFAQAELALAESRITQASNLLKKCLNAISPEDLDFRAAINQQLYRVHKRLARKAIRASQPEAEFENGLGMSRTAGTLEEEIESLFALSEAHERKGNSSAAAASLRKIVRRYGHVEYPVAPAAISHSKHILETSNLVMDKAHALVQSLLYDKAMKRSVSLLKRGLPLYLSTVSPLPKTLHVRAGDLASSKLNRLLKGDPTFGKSFESLGQKTLAGKSPEEQRHRLAEFPGTAAAQQILADLFKQAEAEKNEIGRKKLWQLADAARSSGLNVPERFQPEVDAPQATPQPLALVQPMESRALTLEGGEGTAWLVLERRGNRAHKPNLSFLGGRVKKRLDNKFVLNGVDLNTGKTLWSTGSKIRLRGLGQEPGFFEAFVQGKLVVVHGLYDVIAFDLADGKMRWRYRVPFDFEIRHAVMSGNVLVLAGKAETVALYVPTSNENGEVMWQEKEDGDLYIDPYFHKDRLVSVRKLPFNVTVRYRTTGKLIGRLSLPDLTLHEKHPLLANGPSATPSAHENELLIVTDEWYYIALDTNTLTTRWKRLIDQNDVTRRPALRFALGGDFFAVLKENYDAKAIYMLSSKTGEVLWNTDPKKAGSPQPMFSNFITGGKIYGIIPHPGQGFYMTCLDAQSGKRIYAQEVKGYQSKPNVTLLPRIYGQHLVVQIQDRQEFELKAFETGSGKQVFKVHEKGVGSFGVHGRVSATVQSGRLMLVSKNKVKL